MVIAFGFNHGQNAYYACLPRNILSGLSPSMFAGFFSVHRHFYIVWIMAKIIGTYPLYTIFNGYLMLILSHFLS